MAENGEKQDKFDFDGAREARGYISLEQARVVAMRTARDEPGRLVLPIRRSKLHRLGLGRLGAMG